MLDYTNRVVVISGASSGLGAQMARGFVNQHATLVLMARRLERLESLAKKLEKEGVKYFLLDVMLHLQNLLMQLLN